jgi:RNA polymerase sigma factor (sigma-70 family)
VVLPKSKGEPPIDPGDEFLCTLERSLRKFIRDRVLKHRLPWSYIEDISQEILLQVSKKLDELRVAEAGHRSAWLRLVTRNVVSNAARRWRRSREIEAKWPGTHHVSGPKEEREEDSDSPEERVISPDRGPESEAILDEFRRAFVRAFERLPFRYRSVLRRWLILGESCTEIARRDGRARSSIARLLASGLALLETYLPEFADR